MILIKKNFFNDVGTGLYVADDPNVFLRYNDFKCVTNVAYKNYISTGYTLPAIVIDGVNINGANTLAKGTSVPNAIVDIYSSESCASQCSIRSYLQTVMADNTGKWQANLSNLNGIFYVSATLGNQTSEYKTFQINSDNINIQNLRCSNEASITGLKVPTGLDYYWIDAKGNSISTDLDLKTDKPGQYRLVLGGGCIISDPFQIKDDRVSIFDSGLIKTDVSCGNSNGSIKNLFVYDPESKIKATTWVDGNNKVVGNVSNIANLPSGSYTLKVYTTDGCESDYGPVILKNTTGPNIYQSSVTIQSTNCGQSTGSITNLAVTGTGTLKYIWWNGTQQQVGTAKDLINEPAGVYRLQVTDDTQCGAVYSADILIPETNGITLDESKAQTTVASCSKSNGSVTGLTATGATQYQWTDINNKVVATSVDLQNEPSGDYIFTASNSFGCSKTSKTYHIGLQAPTLFPAFSKTIVSTCLGQNNGSITVNTDALVKSSRWVNSQNVTVGSSATLANIGSGTYQLYLTDQNGCENFYSDYIITAIPLLQIIEDSEQIADDQCNLKTGSITNIRVTGGAPPYTYSWVNASSTAISSSLNLADIGAGNYTLQVNDASKCNIATASFTVQNQDKIMQAPAVSNIQLCSPGDALIRVGNISSAYKYYLYDSKTSVTPRDEQANGNFKVNVKANTSFYISQVSGSCESARSEVKVVVGLSALDIANAFTPNGDGINDYWNIKGIENYPAALVQVFDRYGQIVFESKGYTHPFDGTFKGKNLPVAAYYYIINLATNCSLLSGNLTIIR
jgi:gliding motility-associated-like protein